VIGKQAARSGNGTHSSSRIFTLAGAAQPSNLPIPVVLLLG
jgi:hypothetical protein